MGPLLGPHTHSPRIYESGRRTSATCPKDG